MKRKHAQEQLRLAREHLRNCPVHRLALKTGCVKCDASKKVLEERIKELDSLIAFEGALGAHKLRKKR